MYRNRAQSHNSDQEMVQFKNSKIEHSTGLENRSITSTSSGSSLQRFFLGDQSQAHTELLRLSRTSSYFRNPSFPLVSSPIPRPKISRSSYLHASSLR